MTKSELRRGTVWAAVATAILFVVNVALLLSSPTQYVSRATVRLTGFEPYPAGTPEAFSRLVVQMVEDFADGFLGDAVLSEVAAKLGMQPGAYLKIRKMVRARPILGSASVILSVAHENPATARQIAETLLEVRARMREEFVHHRLAEKAAATLLVENKVRKELDAEIAQLNPAPPSAHLAGAIRAIDASLPGTIIERAMTEAELRSLSAMQKARTLGDTPDEPSQTSYLASSRVSRKWGVVELRRELMESRSAVAALAITRGESHPETKAARARVTAVEQELKSYLEVQIEKQRATLDALEKGESQLAESRAESEKEMKAYLRASFDEGSRRVVIAGLKASLASIVAARHTIELNELSINPLFVIEAPPALPVEPERPQARLSFLACPLLGVIIGLLGLGPRRP